MGGRNSFHVFVLRALFIVTCILMRLSLLIIPKYHKIILLQGLSLKQRIQTVSRYVPFSNNVLAVLFRIQFCNTKNHLFGQLNCCIIPSFSLQKSSETIKRNNFVFFSYTLPVNNIQRISNLALRSIKSLILNKQ